MTKTVNAEDINEFDRTHLFGLTVRITIYYACVGGLLALTLNLAPGAMRHLPIGGVSAISEQSTESVYALEEAILSADDEELERITTQAASTSSWFTDARSLFIAMLGTALLMLPVSWLYKGIHDNGAHDHSLDETALILPAVVAGIVLIVQHSLALAFSLAGIVAGVQFRRALSDTFDTLFIFVAIGVGIAAGIKALEIAAVMSIFFNYSTLLVCRFGDGLESHHAALKKRDRHAKKAAQKISKGEADDKPVS